MFNDDLKFNDNLNTIKSVLKSIGSEIYDDYDGFIVKELKASNTLDENRSTKQTHIAITGDQMDLFPYVRAQGYFDKPYREADKDLKKYFVLQIPVFFDLKNVQYLGGDDSIVNEKAYASVVRSRRDGAVDQMQLSIKNLDSKNFISFRELCHTNYYLLILKRKNELVYDFFAVKPENINPKLKEMNNQIFIASNKTTAVRLDEAANDKVDIVDSNNKDTPKINIGYNKIYYGIPGCGKSHHIETEVLEGVDKENNVFRTTFYLDYSNSDFIGQIYPHVEDKKVTYEPIPGPFTKALERALSTDEMVYLVIEEINRGNAAAIFGDVFQLLDRLKEDKSVGRVVGDSEYPISNAFIEGYFDRVNEKAENADGVKKINFKKGQIIIPHNLTILATMNTSDQNVFPLDTAFKRRWDREKVVTEWSKVKNIKYMYIPCSSITWEQFVTTINQKMIQESQNGDVTISEDKQIGPYFVHESMLSATKNTGGKKELTAFVNNVLDYLYNDVTKFDHSILFDKKVYTYDTLYELMEEYHYQGDKLFEVVFKDSVQKALEEAVYKDSTKEELVNTPEEEYADTEVESMEEPNE